MSLPANPDGRADGCRGRPILRDETADSTRSHAPWPRVSGELPDPDGQPAANARTSRSRSRRRRGSRMRHGLLPLLLRFGTPLAERPPEDLASLGPPITLAHDSSPKKMRGIHRSNTGHDSRPEAPDTGPAGMDPRPSGILRRVGSPPLLSFLSYPTRMKPSTDVCRFRRISSFRREGNR
jgi:hypothetical protein